MLTRIDALATYADLVNLRLWFHGIKDDDTRMNWSLVRHTVLRIRWFETILECKFKCRFKLPLMNDLPRMVNGYDVM